ncbi:hypothetical protein LARI1_G006239 [Lachnellula arida]|uniref:Uncharacterized protein n=1 Tax=Lachnellula arida TaxID=1316785 RepID=A0A8T9B8X3_9HELO|nr:hypothetical protein LARI1_G006239 [Lachnellula arida]
MQFSTTALPAVALIAMVQYCPAPFLAAIPEAVAIGIGAASGVVSAISSVAGNVESGIGKREVELARDFNSRIKRQDYGTGTAWPDCKKQLGSAKVTFSAPAVGTVLVKGVPSACMTLSTVITGKFDEGNPVPQGADSIQFSGLKDADVTAIQNALNAHPSKG